jgi:hypothetical protein
MTARVELLNAAESMTVAAGYIQTLGRHPLAQQLIGQAAALRTLARRIDHEEQWAKDIEQASASNPHIRHAANIVQGVLCRLDADLEGDAR